MVDSHNWGDHPVEELVFHAMFLLPAPTLMWPFLELLETSSPQDFLPQKILPGCLLELELLGAIRYLNCVLSMKHGDFMTI